MRTSKILLTALASAILMAFAAGTASAEQLATDSLDVYIRWERLTFTGDFGAVECEVTLLGSFHRETIPKTRGFLIGSVTHASVGACDGGTAIVHDETLPWLITYEGFQGSLPEMTSAIINLLGAEFEIEPGIGPCEAVTEAGEPGRGIASLNGSGEITNLAAEGTIDVFGDGLCFFATNGTFSGDGVVEADGDGDETPVAITLI